MQIRLYYGENSIIINLTSEQEGRLKQQENSKEKERIPSMWSTGFILPTQIILSSCSKCNRTYQESPNLQVSISNFGSKEIGTQVGCHCKNCNSLIYHSYLPSPEGIPEEFIVYDETGDYKRPTTESIDTLLTRIAKQAEEGIGNRIDNPGFRNELETAKRWAGKIKYEIDEQIKQVNEKFRTGYVNRLERELPALVEEIKRDAYGFSLTINEEDQDVSAYQGTGLSDHMDRLLQTIRLTTPANPEINKDIVRIFEAYWGMHHKAKQELLKEKKELEERIASEEEYLSSIRRQQGDFVHRVALGNQEIDEARRTPLDNWPLKDDIPF